MITQIMNRFMKYQFDVNLLISEMHKYLADKCLPTEHHAL